MNIPGQPNFTESIEPLEDVYAPQLRARAFDALVAEGHSPAEAEQIAEASVSKVISDLRIARDNSYS